MFNSGLLKNVGDACKHLQELRQSRLVVVPHQLLGLRSNIAGRMITDPRRLLVDRATRRVLLMSRMTMRSSPLSSNLGMLFPRGALRAALGR